MDKALVEFARTVFAGGDPDHKPCQDCGGVHARTCPRVAKLQVAVNGDGIITERTVEYWPPGTWETFGIIWPEDVYEDDDSGAGDGSPD